MRAHAEQEGLVALRGAEDPDVGSGRRGKQAPQAVERLRAHRHLPGPFGLAGLARGPRAPVVLEDGNPARVGLEGAVEGLDVARAERVAAQLRGPVITPITAGTIG